MPEHKYNYPKKFLTKDGKLNKRMMKQIREWRAKHGKAAHGKKAHKSAAHKKQAARQRYCNTKLRKVRSGEAKCKNGKVRRGHISKCYRIRNCVKPGSRTAKQADKKIHKQKKLMSKIRKGKKLKQVSYSV